MADLTVANTILEQLGGRRFLAMTGAKNLVGGDRRLTFRLPSAKCDGKRLSGMWITLADDDTYTLEAVRFDRASAEHKILGRREGIYCDELQEAFTALTGLYTRL